MPNPLTASRRGKALVPPGLGHRESAMLNPSGPAPGWLFGERGSILCSRSRVRETGTLQVSRRETAGESQKLTRLSHVRQSE